MKKAVLSVALAASAVLAVVACSDVPATPPAVSSKSLDGSNPSKDVGSAATAELQVCLSSSSTSAATYTVDGSNVSGLYGNENLNTGAAMPITPGDCIIIIQKHDEGPTVLEGGWVWPAATGVPAVTANVPGTWTYSCVTQEPSFRPSPADGSGNSVSAQVNYFHGSTLTMTFTPTIPHAPSACVLDYPYTSSNPRTATVFNESEVLSAFAYNSAAGEVRVWYTDEHALLLGVRQLVTHGKTPPDVTQNFGIATMAGNPSSASGNPLAVGNAAVTGAGASVDPAGRPIFPSLYITDITDDPSSTSGDWQYNGTARLPNKIYGSWKSAMLKVDNTKVPATSAYTVDADPAKNNLNLGSGDAVPNGVSTEGYTTEIVWSLASLGLNPLRNYRLQFMVHDGDQNKGGGDVGEACLNVGPGIGDQVVVAQTTVKKK